MSSDKDWGETVEYDPEEGVYRARYEQGSCPPSLALVKAIAAIEGVDPLAVEPLGETADIGALDAVIQSLSDDHYVQMPFRSQGYRVTIHGDGSLDLRPIESDASPDTAD